MVLSKISVGKNISSREFAPAFLQQESIIQNTYTYIFNYFFQHMIRFRYIPFTFGKPKFASKEEPKPTH